MRVMDKRPDQQTPKKPEIEPTEHDNEFVRDEVGRLLRRYKHHKRRRLKRRSKPPRSLSEQTAFGHAKKAVHFCKSFVCNARRSEQKSEKRSRRRDRPTL